MPSASPWTHALLLGQTRTMPHYMQPIEAVKGRNAQSEIQRRPLIKPPAPLDLNASIGRRASHPNSGSSRQSRSHKASPHRSWSSSSTVTPRVVSREPSRDPAGRPSPKKTTVVLSGAAWPAYEKPSASVLYEGSASPERAPAGPSAKERLRQITLGQLIQSKRTVEATMASGEDAITHGEDRIMRGFGGNLLPTSLVLKLRIKAHQLPWRAQKCNTGSVS